MIGFEGGWAEYFGQIAGCQPAHYIHLKHTVLGGYVTLDEQCVLKRVGFNMRDSETIAAHIDRLSDQGCDRTGGLRQRAIEDPIESNCRNDTGSGDQ